MTSAIFAGTMRRHLILASAAVFLNIGGAWASGGTGDPQELARELLAGKTSSRVAIPPSRSIADDTVRVDPQEQAQQLLLGTRPPGAKRHDVTRLAKAESGRGSRRVYSDGQATARRMILGKDG